MSLAEKIQEVDSLQSKIEGFGKLPDAVLKKINYKFRLEWNYTSNSMEGNTLTLEETRSVMVGNITVEGKPLKDVLEMKGHDDIITNILKIGKKELNISENKIKDIHKGIMYEDDPAKQEKIGKWKTQPNYILNYKGERNDFTAPEEVSDEMHKLVNWLNTEKEKHDRATKEAMHPALIAFKFHLDYISIHPFYDGNGRTARILMNLILISYGYPPVYIKANEKTPYYQYLADIQGYGGEPDLFYDYMLGLLMRSQRLVLNAMEGKNIEEDDDIDKEINLFKISFEKKDERKEIRTSENVKTIIVNSAIPLFEKTISKLSQFNDLFHKAKHRIIFCIKDGPLYDVRLQKGGWVLSAKKFPDIVYNWLEGSYLTQQVISFGLEYQLEGYKRGYPIDVRYFINLVFDKYTYHLTADSGIKGHEHYIENNYENALSESSISFAITDIMKVILQYLKENTQKIEP